MKMVRHLNILYNKFNPLLKNILKRGHALSIFLARFFVNQKEVSRLKTRQEILGELKTELLRIGSTNQRDYDLLKRKRQVYSTTICRRLKLSWPEVVNQTGLKFIST